MEYMDLLSRLGVASAHPGGFKATRKLLEKELEPHGQRILEVGCGTGKTACYLQSKGHQVTALDLHPIMLEKARKRAEKEGLTGIQWVQGSTEALPFEDESFDLVYAESVTLFTNVARSLKEYHRVLKPSGRLLDRELVRFDSIPDPVYQEITDFFKFDQIMSAEEWLDQFRQSGFRCSPPEYEQFRSQEQAVDPSEIQELDISMLLDPEIARSIMKYTELMLAQEHYFRVCNFVAHKSDSYDIRNKRTGGASDMLIP